ncbi:hypothetical protein E1193_14685 [Micromonospora sp. KC606]|nr:hypothetical protein E1193_14685 [Micromonospora sp. KC606]
MGQGECLRTRPSRAALTAAERFTDIAAETLNEAAPAPMAIPAPDAARPWSIVFAPHAAGSNQ